MKNNTESLIKPLARSQAELCVQIQQKFSRLSKRLQQLAHYILENQAEIAFNTVVTIAKRANVHPSSLIRFANAFGFSGFSDMQKLFKAKLIEGNSDYQQRIEAVQGDTSLSQEHANKQLLSQLCEANNQALSVLAQQIDAKALGRAQEILNQASVIHVQAVRRAFPVATYFAYLLGNINKPVHLLDSLGGMHKQQQTLINADSVLVAISFYPYGSETTELAQNTAARGVPVVAFTDSLLSPLAQLAEVCFCVKEAEIHCFRSLNATMSLVQAVAISLIPRSEIDSDPSLTSKV
jgi:DNA-binding MurR/RpiR family transcriptional regulator